jgi:hypothetical protein
MFFGMLVLPIVGFTGALAARRLKDLAGEAAGIGDYDHVDASECVFLRMEAPLSSPGQFVVYSITALHPGGRKWKCRRNEY